MDGDDMLLFNFGADSELQGDTKQKTVNFIVTIMKILICEKVAYCMWLMISVQCLQFILVS
jgi:hypothetical protein